MPRTAQAQPGQKIGNQITSPEAEVLAHEGLLEVHAICGKLKPSTPFTTAPMKIARILDKSGGSFLLEYDNTLGSKHTMSLEAFTYEAALREARSYLEIGDDARDSDGAEWDLE